MTKWLGNSFERIHLTKHSFVDSKRALVVGFRISGYRPLPVMLKPVTGVSGCSGSALNMSLNWPARF